MSGAIDLRQAHRAAAITALGLGTSLVLPVAGG
jgi:hypothetical protein